MDLNLNTEELNETMNKIHNELYCYCVQTYGAQKAVERIGWIQEMVHLATVSQQFNKITLNYFLNINFFQTRCNELKDSFFVAQIFFPEQHTEV